MSSKDKFDYFKFLYEQERSRYLELINRGKLFLTVVTLYFGVLAVALDKTIDLNKINLFQKLVYGSSFVFLVASLVFIIRSISIYRNEKPSNPIKLIESLENELKDDEIFTNKTIVDLSVATSRNAENNDHRSRMLRIATNFMLCAVGAQLIYFFSYLIKG